MMRVQGYPLKCAADFSSTLWGRLQLRLQAKTFTCETATPTHTVMLPKIVKIRTHLTRKCGNYSDVLPLKAPDATAFPIQHLSRLRIWAAHKSNGVSFRVAVGCHVNADMGGAPIGAGGDMTPPLLEAKGTGGT